MLYARRLPFGTFLAWFNTAIERRRLEESSLRATMEGEDGNR